MERSVKALPLAVGILFLIACSMLPSILPTSLNPDLAKTEALTSATAHSSSKNLPVPSATVLPSPFQATDTIPAANAIVFRSPQKYGVEYIATVTNNGFTISDLEVYQPKPVEWDGQKEIEIEEVSPAGVQEARDSVYGNGIYYWHVRNAPARGKSLAFKIRFRFTALEINVRIDADAIQPYDRQDALYRLYTQPERFIESDNPEILALADQIAGGETNPYRLARKFYDYVVANARYRLVGKGLLGAKALLDNGEGECGEFASLFIALSRAKGIPARSVVGYWAISGIEQTHVWAEFYLEGLGWIPVDPTIGQSQPVKDGIPDYYFGNMDNQRVILNKGFNIPLQPQAPDDYIAPFLQVPLWWYWGTEGDSNSVSMERTVWEVTSIS